MWVMHACRVLAATRPDQPMISLTESALQGLVQWANEGTEVPLPPKEWREMEHDVSKAAFGSRNRVRGEASSELWFSGDASPDSWHRGSHASSSCHAHVALSDRYLTLEPEPPPKLLPQGEGAKAIA